jgi:hypothetical protein
MRLGIAPVALLLALVPATARAELLRCSEIPAAQRYVEGLKPGPDTTKAREHLDAAKHAASDQECDKELRQVDLYARRAAGEKRDAAPTAPAPSSHVQCADWLHQGRPGGSDYHGPPVAGCPAGR